MALQATFLWPPARSRLAGVRQSLARLRRLHEHAGDALADWIARNFEAEGALLDDFPAGWPPLAPATLARRSRRGRGSKPLQDTGRLRRGIAWRADDRALVLGNAVPYAARHQLGEGVPRRPFLPGARQVERLLSPVVERYVREALR